MSRTVARPCTSPRHRAVAASAMVLLMAALLLLASCGGGVGIGGTGSFAGAGSYSAGPVSGFGSIIVGGIEYDDARAAVLDDDGISLATGRAGIRLGTVVEVQGGEVTAGALGPMAVASTVQLARLAVGPVTSIDAAAGRLTVLGQTLQTNGSTVFDPALRGGLSGLRVGDTVSAHALATAAGNPIATRIEAAGAADPWRLRGFATTVDASARRLVVGAATLDYGSALNVLSDLAPGQYLHLRLERGTPAGALRVSSFLPASSAPGSVASVTVEGVITAPNNSNLFRVGALFIDVSGATVTPASAVLLPGVQVLVQGRLDGKTLVAETVTVTSSDVNERRTYQLTGNVTDVNAASQTFAVRGVSVDYSDARFVNGSAASLAVGASVHVRGTLSADRTALQARTVSFP